MSVDEKRSVDGEAIEELLREHVTEYQSCEGDDGASWLAGRILAALRAQGGGTDAISALVLENVLECIGLVRGELGDGKRADLADEEIRRVIMALRTQGGTGENEVVNATVKDLRATDTDDGNLRELLLQAADELEIARRYQIAARARTGEPSEFVDTLGPLPGAVPPASLAPATGRAESEVLGARAFKVLAEVVADPMYTTDAPRAEIQEVLDWLHGLGFAAPTDGGTE